MKNIFSDLENGRDVRQNLIRLRKMVHEDKNGKFLSEIRGNEKYKDILVDCLSDEDPKARRSAALLLGDTQDNSLLSVLMYAYKHEDKLFIRSDYLKAIGKLDYIWVLNDLKKRLDDIDRMHMGEENRKHLTEEKKELRNLILKAEPPAKHRFTGWNAPSEMMLVVSPGLENYVAGRLPEDAELLATGKGALYIRCTDLHKVMKLRCVKSFLFAFAGNRTVENNAAAVAAMVKEGGLLQYIVSRHEGAPPYYFRLDLRTHHVLEEKSRFIRRLEAQIEEESGGKLINSASEYEFTLRVIENRDTRCGVFLEMGSIPDRRFAYRRNALPTSTAPVRAAEIVALAADYLVPDAAVLDPFCGTGTLLIERAFYKRTAHLYGVDKYGEAIRMASENMKAAGVNAYLINKDCLEFNHKYNFDEILSELPSVAPKTPRQELAGLYRLFLAKLQEWAADSASVIVCTSEPELLLGFTRRNRHLQLQETIRLSGKRGDTLIIYKYRR